MAQLLKNNASGVLSVGINTTATSLTLVDASGFPSPTGGDYCLATLIGLNTNGIENAWEIVSITGRTTNTLTVARAQEGTTALAWGVGATIQARLTAAGLPISTAVSGLGTGVATALAVAVGTAGAPVVNGGALGTPSSGTLSSCTVDGTNAVGFRTVPQNSQSAAYTTVLADSGKHIYHPSADTTARTWTIDSNANVPYPIGTAITFINDTSAGTLTIAITSDTMILAGVGTTGSRTLAASGIATAVKMTSTRWIISGANLT